MVEDSYWTGEKQDRKDVSREVASGGMKGRKCAGPELCKAEGMPDKRDAGQ